MAHDPARRIGRRAPPFRGVIERERIVEYAHALRLSDPIHSDREAALAAGYRDVVAPPGFLTPFSLQPRSAKFDTFAIDESRALAGEWGWEHHAVVCAGDELRGFSELVDVACKQGRRPMRVLTIVTWFLDADGQPVVTVHDTTLEFIE